MNKLTLLFIFSIIICTNTLNAQSKKEYLLGVEGWGGYRQYKNSSQFGSSETRHFFTFSKIYGGKFLTPKIVALVFFQVDYSNNKSKGIGSNFTNINTTTVLTPQLGLGVRKYFSLAQKDIVGLFLDAETSFGFSNTNNKEEIIFDTAVETDESKTNSNQFSFTIQPGAYINITKKWQMLFKLGGFYYSYIWSKSALVTSSITGPTKGFNIGVDFNAQEFRLSIVRFL